MKKPILIVSPIPSHPQFQGNSARIYQIGRLFQDAGHPVHFVYFGLEGLTPDQRQEKMACWDLFAYVQPKDMILEPSLGEYFHLDDWFDDRVSVLVEDLCEQWSYAACLVNYVWFSKVLEVIPEGVLKIIDTHDVFGDRHLEAQKSGLEPVWFYTSKAMEAHGLSRADLILAIQDEEAAYFRNEVSVDVLSVGYVIPDHPLPERRYSEHAKLRVGYLGSSNPFNVHAIREIADGLKVQSALSQYYEFHLAGDICRAFQDDGAIFNLWGRVPDVADFYRDMDVLLNPMVGGTGLKIKSVEVLAYRKPLLATHDAMVGICSEHELSVCENPEEILKRLGGLKGDRKELADICVSPAVWHDYVLEQKQNFNKLLEKISEHI